jgi:tRNA(adenine34) deaminase
MTQHEEFIRMSHQLAIEAGENGDHPFGAILAYENKILMKAKNTVNSDKDPTHHAELNLIVASLRELP